MRILHITRSDFGNATARAVLGLHEALLRRGADSRLLVAEQLTSAPAVTSAQPCGKSARDEAFGRLQEFAFDLCPSNILASRFTVGMPGVPLDFSGPDFDVDVVHLHDVRGFLPPPAVRRLLLSGRKVVWSLYDSWAFTGGCHHHLGCEKHALDCAGCPQLPDAMKYLPAELLLDKLRIPPGAVAAVIPQVSDVAASAKRSAVLRDVAEWFDVPWMHPPVTATLPREAARAALGLSPGKLVLLVVCENGRRLARMPESAGHFLDDCMRFNAFKRLAKSGGLEVVALGVEDGRMDFHGIPLHGIRAARDRAHLNEIHSAADLTVLPDAEECTPFAAMESARAGTPVLGYRIADVEKIVADHDTGRLLPYWNPRQLAEAASVLLLNPERLRGMAEKCRAGVLPVGGDEVAAKYEVVYRACAEKPGASLGAPVKDEEPLLDPFREVNIVCHRGMRVDAHQHLALARRGENFAKITLHIGQKLAMIEGKLGDARNVTGEEAVRQMKDIGTSVEKLRKRMKKYIQREEYAKLKASLAANPRWLEREDDSDVRAVPATREGSSFDGRNASIPLDAAPHSERPPLPPERLHRPADRLLGWLAGTAWKKEHRIGLLSQYPPRPMRLERFPKPRVRSGKLPSIAVVTPSFMQGHFIERTILSVIDQNYPDLRYAVQDAGSTDETQEIIRRHAARIASWSSEPDTGQARAICNGFEKIDGEIMSWLNSDDTLMPGALRCVGEFFHKHPEVDAVYGHRVLIDEDDREVARWVLPPHDNEVLRWADYVPQETLFWRRKLWDAVGGVDPKFRFAIDWDLILRFQHAGARIVRLPYFLGCFRVHASQKTSAQSDSVGAEEVGYLRWREHGCDPHWQDMNKVLRLIESRSAVCARLLAMGVRI